ncbi:hypothetical protein TKK_0006347 [Trichogramma kaykai]
MMDMTGSASQLMPKGTRRQFFQWIVKWFYANSPDNNLLKPDISAIICMLQAVGFQLRQFEKCEAAKTANEPVKPNNTRITLECGTSKMVATLEMNDVACECPSDSDRDNADGSFWSITGSGPAGENMLHSSMNHIEETGSNLLPEMSKETTLLVREITQRLFTIISGKCEPCNNDDAVPMLSSNQKLNASIAKSTEKMENLTRSYTDYFDSQFKPRTFVPNGTNLFNGRLVAARSVNDVGRATEIPKLTRQGTYELDPSPNDSFEARKSPPRPAISPPLSHALSESLGQISIQSSDEELFGLADYVVKAHQILDRAVNFIAKKLPNQPVSSNMSFAEDPEETPENQAQKMARLMPPPLMNSSFCTSAPRSLGKIQTSVARTSTTTSTTGGAAVKPPPIRRAVSAIAGSKVAASTTTGTRRVATPPTKPGPIRTLSSLQAKAQVAKPIISGTAKRKSATGNNNTGSPGGPSAIAQRTNLATKPPIVTKLVGAKALPATVTNRSLLAKRASVFEQKAAAAAAGATAKIGTPIVTGKTASLLRPPSHVIASRLNASTALANGSKFGFTGLKK